MTNVVIPVKFDNGWEQKGTLRQRQKFFFCVTTTSSSFFLHYTHLLKIIDYLRGMVSRLQQDQVYNECCNKLKKRFQEQTKLAVACCFSTSVLHINWLVLNILLPIVYTKVLCTAITAILFAIFTSREAPGHQTLLVVLVLLGKPFFQFLCFIFLGRRFSNVFIVISFLQVTIHFFG